ncbi:MAG: 5-carboxymethyl-2-hydroxymuconate isomerase, partial [Betaproteobacteria bacterium]
MPHLVIYYTRNLDDETDIDRLCRSLADAMLQIKDDAGSPVFPEGGIR